MLFCNAEDEDDELSSSCELSITAPTTPEFTSASRSVCRVRPGHATHILVGDNYDTTVHASHMTVDHQNLSLHCFQFLGVLDRIDFSHLPNDRPIGDVLKLCISTFLPDVGDCLKFRENYAILIGRVLVKKLPFFKIFEDCTPKHIEHKYSEAMSKKSEIVCLVYICMNLYILLHYTIIGPTWCYSKK